ncbi:MAG: hypothetical protein ACRCWR_11140 [Saezia sp.]
MKIYEKSFIKTLTASEINSLSSNQHELHGVSKLEAIFGTQRKNIPATLRINYQDPPHNVNITWYDSRENSVDRKEYRLYYSSNIDHKLNGIKEGSNILIGQDKSGNIEIIIFPSPDKTFGSWTQC